MSIRRDAFRMVEPYRGVWECQICKAHLDVGRGMQIELLNEHWRTHKEVA